MINYKLINDSIDFYEKKDFVRIETPWTVSEYVDKLTKPKNKISLQLKHNNKCLVGSGEQSFLYLYLKDFLPKGQFQTVTPCFRDENFDLFHTKYFIKCELIKTDKVSIIELENIVETCLNFYKIYLPESNVIETDIGFDIECSGIELGSYGIRTCDYLEYIFGTGCAEPRLSQTIKKIKNGLS